MNVAPMNVAPLVWLLLFDAVVCVVYWLATSVFGVTAPDKLMKVMVGIVILINVVIILFWVLALFGVSPDGLMHGPQRGR